METKVIAARFPRKRIVMALAACGIAAAAMVAPQGARASDKAANGGIAAQPKFTLIPVEITTPLGTTSLPQRAVLTNTFLGGPSTVFFNTNSLGSNFFYTTDCPVSPAQLADGSSCNFDITYRPTDLTQDIGQINIFCCGDDPDIIILGTPTRSRTPLLQTAPSRLDFPPVEVGDFSEVQYLTIRSVSGVSMSVGINGVGDVLVLEPVPSLAQTHDAVPKAPAPKGAKEPPPSFAGNCYGFLSPLQACDLGVVFGPRATGARSGTVLLSTDISLSTLNVAARGTGLPAGGLSVLTVSDRIDFGQVPVGATSTPKPFGIVNNTTGAVTISELTVTGDFELQKGACDTIAAGAPCSENIVFKPTTLGPRTGSATVRTPADPNPYVTPLSGAGVVNPNPFLSLSATQLGYGSGIIGSGESLNLIITATGQVPVNISRIYALGDFLPTHACPASLGPGTSCTIEVGFSPRLLGARSGSLVVESNAVGSPHSVDLRGNGCTFFSASTRGRTLLCSAN